VNAAKACYVSCVTHCDQQHVTVLEVTADWHGLMVLQHIVQPVVEYKWTSDASSRHTAAESAILGLHLLVTLPATSASEVTT